ncbi:PadR family transcriptional regulator [Nocardia sp. NPDC088792]|uniref:PadR family transcriptional regulator n=1 Tax=Nocardia sp. NPDC088792 TaxID=3364332 RepID=UPI0037F33C54
MKLEHLLLGVLGAQPATGYDLKKFFDSHGRFLRSNTQMSQVYRTLGKMAEQGWVGFDVRPRQGPPDAKTYYVTAEGMTVFLDWLTGPYIPPSIFTDREFLGRMVFAGFMNGEQILRLIDIELAARYDQRARFRDREIVLTPESEFDFDRGLSQLVGRRLHEFGSAGLDRHVENMEQLRKELVERTTR